MTYGENDDGTADDRADETRGPARFTLVRRGQADTTATQQVAVVVGVIAVAQGLGTAALGLSGILIGITIWVLIAGIIAIRQALDFSTGRAIVTAILGWLALAIPMVLLAG